MPELPLVWIAASDNQITYQYAALGEAYKKTSQFADARKALGLGLAIAEKNDECCHEAELRRLMGELLLAESSDHASAEAYFHQAIETAQRQKSRAWELRSTLSLRGSGNSRGVSTRLVTHSRRSREPTRKVSQRRIL